MKQTLLLAIALGAMACTSGNKASTTAVPDRNDEAVQAPRPGGTGKSDSLFLYLERTPCFGQCKAYRIDLYRSGYAVFDGRMNMEKEGRHSARVGQDTLYRIIAMADELGFYSLQDKYDGEVTDLPSTFLRIVADGKDKRVIGRVGQPPAFKQLVARIEELLLPVAWVPVTPEP